MFSWRHGCDSHGGGAVARCGGRARVHEPGKLGRITTERLLNT
jgi:hypothetical protein